MTSEHKAREELLEVLGEIEKDIKKLHDEELECHVKTLREKVKALFDASETRVKELEKRLNQEISELKAKVDQQKGNLMAEAQATRLWESHVARFVISSGTDLEKINKYKHMKRLVEGRARDRQLKGRARNRQREEAYRWKKIQDAAGIEWEDDLYYDFIKPIREERNMAAHPSYIDLDETEQSLMKDATPDEQKRIKGMFDMLKATASLMKFGRLAFDFQEDEKWFPELSFSREKRQALGMMAKWDRSFKQFENGPQCIEHNNAIEYLKKYVDEDKLRSCLLVADAIKNVNGKRLGKLAWTFEGDVLDHVCQPENIYSIHDMNKWIGDLEEDSQEWKKWKKITQGKMWTSAHSEALEKLERLLPNPDDDVPDIDPETAQCAIPDFLEKCLWESALDILNWFEKMTYDSKKRKCPYLMRSHRKKSASMFFTQRNPAVY